MLSQEIFGTIRKTEGRRWIDTKTLSCLIEVSKEKTKLVEKECGVNWTNENPALYVSRIKLTESTSVYTF